MPIYEYRCTKCRHHVEVIQKIGDRPLRKCSECSGKLEKLVSVASFHLKGGGWYSEGYSKGGAKKGKNTEGDAKSKSGSGETKGNGKKSASAV
jgi:putative FmdB family regulatory protein